MSRHPNVALQLRGAIFGRLLENLDIASNIDANQILLYDQKWVPLAEIQR